MAQNDLYDEEQLKIYKRGIQVQRRWREIARTIEITNLKDTSKKLNEFHKYAVGEFEKLGFIAEVDVTPIWADKPPTISIIGRTEYHEFDHDRKRYEVRKAKEEGRDKAV